MLLVNSLYFPAQDGLTLDFEKLFNGHGSVMLVIDPKTGIIEQANKAAVDFYGYGDKLKGMNIDEINTLSFEEIEVEMKCAEIESRNYFLFQHKLFDETVKEVEVYSYPMEYGGKMVLYSIIQDISEKKRLEREINSRSIIFSLILGIFVAIQFFFIIKLKSTQTKLKISEKNYRNLFENMSEGFANFELLFDESGNAYDFRYLDINRNFEIITGIKRELVLNKSGKEVSPSLDENIFGKYSEVALKGVNDDFERSFPELGKVFHVKSFCPEKGKFAALFFDITKQKNTEKNLYIQKENMKTTLESIGEGVITTDNLGIITMINHFGEEITGCSSKEFVGEKFDDIFKILDDMQGSIMNDIVQNVIESKNKVRFEEDSYLICGAGKKIAVTISVSPIIDNSDELLGTVIVFKDISQLREKQKKIEYLSYHDSLTGLYNRRFFQEEMNRLEHCRNLPISLLIGDINALKLTNDSFGHEIGDKLIVKIANILKRNSRAEDILARWGGDEFVLLLPNADERITEEISRRIKNSMESEFVESVKTSISVGYSTKYDKSVSMKEVFKKAEIMMYENKMAESNQVKLSIVNNMVRLLEKTKSGFTPSQDEIGKLPLFIKVMGITEEKAVQKCSKAFFYRDIGYTSIHNDFLNKSSTLTEFEWNEIKKSPETGYRILCSVNDLKEISEAVLFHHERWDGKGYPKGLKKEEIPVISRIISVLEAYYAMINERPYRKALTKAAALEEIRKNSGTQFDPDISEAFFQYFKNN